MTQSIAKQREEKWLFPCGAPYNQKDVSPPSLPQAAEPRPQLYHTAFKPLNKRQHACAWSSARLRWCRGHVAALCRERAPKCRQQSRGACQGSREILELVQLVQDLGKGGPLLRVRVQASLAQFPVALRRRLRELEFLAQDCDVVDDLRARGNKTCHNHYALGRGAAYWTALADRIDVFFSADVFQRRLVP